MALITQEQAKQARDTAEKFVNCFSKPFGDGYTQEHFLAIFDPSAQWTDHAFHIRRIGHEAILGLRKAFLHCNQPFRSEAKSISPTPEGAVVELLWIGCCANDIVRPNGEVAVKGTGKNFRAHVCFLLKIDDAGRITKIDEYYNKLWDTGVEETEYTVVQGVYSKD